jgi:Protein of unknown function (DUF3054)
VCRSGWYAAAYATGAYGAAAQGRNAGAAAGAAAKAWALGIPVSCSRCRPRLLGFWHREPKALELLSFVHYDRQTSKLTPSWGSTHSCQQWSRFAGWRSDEASEQRCRAAAQLALALRSASRGAPPPVPFVVVASIATAVLIIGWRTALAALSPQVRRSCWRPSVFQTTLHPDLYGCRIAHSSHHLQRFYARQYLAG